MDKVVIDFDSKTSRFEVYVPFTRLELARNFPDRRWNKTKKRWIAPLVRKNVEYIMNTLMKSTGVRVELSQAAKDAIIESKQRVQKRTVTRPFPEWFPFKYPPMKHQKEPLDRFYDKPVGGLFYPVGSGKSKISIDLLSAKAMDVGDNHIDGALILCPYSIRKNWLKQLQEHCPIDYRAEVLDYSTTRGKRAFNELLDSEDKLRVLIVGIESLSSGSAKYFVDTFLLAVGGKDGAAIIVDESQRIKNPSAKRTRACLELAKNSRFRMIMTGTPITQGILDLYSQMLFLDKDIIGFNDYYSFRNRYAVLGGYSGKEVIGYKNVDELMSAIKPYVCQATKEEVHNNLPPATYMVREVKMTEKQKAMYKKISLEKLIEVEDSQIAVTNALAKLTRLQQVTGGFTVKETTDPVSGELVTEPYFLGSGKIDEVVSIAEEAGEDMNIIVWCKFVPEIELVAKVLSEKFGGDKVVTFHGQLTDQQRWENLAKFERREARFFVANPRLGGIGLDILAGDIAIFYSNTFSYEDRIQAEGRNLRTGRKNPVVYIDLVCEGTVDAHVIEIIKTKGTMAAFVREALHRGKDPIKEMENSCE